MSDNASESAPEVPVREGRGKAASIYSLAFLLAVAVTGAIFFGVRTPGRRALLLITLVPTVPTALLALRQLFVPWAMRWVYRSRFRRHARNTLEQSFTDGVPVVLEGTLRGTTTLRSPLERRSCAGFAARVPDALGGYETRSAMGDVELETLEYGSVLLRGGRWEVCDPFDERVLHGEARVVEGDRVLVAARAEEVAVPGEGYRSMSAGCALLPDEARLLVLKGREAPYVRARHKSFAWVVPVALGVVSTIIASRRSTEPLPSTNLGTPVGLDAMCDGHRYCREGLECASLDEGDVCRPRCGSTSPCPGGRFCLHRGICVEGGHEGEFCAEGAECAPGLQCVNHFLQARSARAMCEHSCRSDDDCPSNKWCVRFRAMTTPESFCQAPDDILDGFRVILESERRERARGDAAVLGAGVDAL